MTTDVDSYDRGLRDGVIAAKETLQLAIALQDPAKAFEVLDRIIADAAGRLEGDA